MRCLILGGDGMLGHQLLESWGDRHEVRVTLRRPLPEYGRFRMFSRKNSFDHVDVRDSGCLWKILDEYRPEAVVNAVGLVKQRTAARDPVASLEVNSVFPHRLNSLCQDAGVRLIHLSTDCVFSGRTGQYTEASPPDPQDLYGRTKQLGEVSEAPAVTLRTSIIGLELKHKQSLVEWFLAQTGLIKGYTRALYTGLTTREIGRVIERVLLEQPELTGVWHVASAPISKYELLNRLSALLGRTDLRIVPDDTFVCDRSLNGSAFCRQTGYQPPSWDRMLKELASQIRERRRADDAAA